MLSREVEVVQELLVAQPVDLESFDDEVRGMAWYDGFEVGGVERCNGGEE